MDLSDWVVMFSRGWQPISSSPWGQLKMPSHNFSAPMQPPGGGQGNWPTGQRWVVVAVGEGCVPACEERLLIEKPQARKGKLNTLCYLKKKKKKHTTVHLIWSITTVIDSIANHALWTCRHTVAISALKLFLSAASPGGDWWWWVEKKNLTINDVLAWKQRS